jgi:hypothetical protein
MILDIVLLVLDSYFSLNTVSFADFGIRGAVINGSYMAYNEISDNCNLGEYCEYIQKFKTGGGILQGIIIFDMVILALVILQNYLLRFILQKVINEKETLSNSKKNFIKVLVFGKKLLFIHPILINLGIILWITCSNLDNLSKLIVLHEGIIVLIVQSFLSLLTIAYNFWIISSTRRRNLRLLRSGNYKKEEFNNL